jgi:undecaprenyl-diphosphatase
MRYDWLDETFIFLATDFGIVLIVIILIFLVTHRHRGYGIKNILVIFTTAILAWAVAEVVKHFYISPRPFVTLPPEKVNLLFKHGSLDSFPSGHATFFSALAVALYAYHKSIGSWYLVGALLIGISRIVVGIHWPTDILAGYIIGGVIGYFVYYFINKYFSI